MNPLMYTYIHASLQQSFSSLDRRPLADAKPHILVVTHTAINDITSRHFLVRNLGLVCPEELQRCLEKLHVRDLPAQAHPGAIPKGHVVLKELLCLLQVLEPPLGAELTRIVAVQVLVAVHEPGVACQLRPLGHEQVISKVDPTRPSDTREDVGSRGGEAHRLAHA